jgi:hypothetical protein
MKEGVSRMKNYLMVFKEKYCYNNSEVNHTIYNTGCSFAIAANEEELSHHRLALSIADQSDTNVITAATFFNSSGTLKLTDAVVVHSARELSVNTSFCHISSLEVYRGRQNTTEIRQDGFALSQMGTIEANN